MSNMSYCRFQNTLGDLRDCKEAFEGVVLNGSEYGKLSDAEAAAFVDMIELMREFIDSIDTHSEIDEEDIYDIRTLRKAFPNLTDK